MPITDLDVVAGKGGLCCPSSAETRRSWSVSDNIRLHLRSSIFVRFQKLEFESRSIREAETSCLRGGRQQCGTAPPHLAQNHREIPFYWNPICLKKKLKEFWTKIPFYWNPICAGKYCNSFGARQTSRPPEESSTSIFSIALLRASIRPLRKKYHG